MKKSLLALLPFLCGCAGEAPQNIGVQNNRLTACPQSPNCVSSYENDESHGIQPLTASLADVEQILLGYDDANIVSSDGTYLYAEFTTPLMGYVDDVEFLYDTANGVTHVRSASRLGYSDLGANRHRVERIRRSLNAD